MNITKPDDIKDEEEIWKDISVFLFQHYQASTHGRIRRKNKYEEYEVLSTSINTGGYIAVSLKGNNDRFYKYMSHRLVAATFIDIPEDGLFEKYKYSTIDNIPYLVNHIDGNKLNCRKSNLEWCDCKYNIQHGFLGNNHSATIECTMRNIITGEEIVFKSAKLLGEYLQINVRNIPSIIANYSKVPYLDKYLFINFDSERLNKTRVSLKKELICKDYVSGEIIIANSSKELSVLTGIIAGTIDTRIYGKYGKNKLISGYVFKSLEEHDSLWPEYTKEEAKQSRAIYSNRVKTGNSKTTAKEVIVKDYVSGAIEKHNSIKAATEYYKYSDSIIEYYTRLNSNGRKPKLYDGKVFVYSHLGSDFPIYTEEEAKDSVRSKNLTDAGVNGAACRKRILGKYYPSGKVTEFDSVIHAAKSIGCDRGSISDRLNRPTIKSTYKGWWFIPKTKFKEWPIFSQKDIYR